MVKYNFKRLDWKFDKVLICPSCMEKLYRVDIEHFNSCPYCNHKIDAVLEIEDYLLKPTIDRWVTIQNFATNPFMNSRMIHNDNEQIFF